MSELPKGWTITTLDSVADWGSGGTPSRKNPEFFNGSIPWIKTGELGDKYVRTAEEFLSEEAIKKSSAKVFPKGSVGIAMYGATIGKASIWGIDASTNQACAVAQCKSEIIDAEFLYYFLLSEKRGFINAGKGGAQPNISQGVLKDWPISLPPCNEQKRIVSKIEELFSELDSGIESLKTAREQLKVYRQAVLKHAFEEAGGQQTTLGKLLEYVTSGSRGWAQYYADVGELFIRAQNLKYDRLDLTERAYVSLPNKTEGTRTKVQVGDLLITITGANVTKSALIETDLGTTYVSQHVALCRPIKGVLPKFLYWFVIAEAAGRKQLSAAAYGAGKPGLNLDNIKSVQINIPSHDQQLAVVQKIESQLSVCENLQLVIDTELQKSEALRQSILKKAFSGQLVTQNPADEPASLLLERIRTEKTTATAKKPKAKRRAA